MSIKVMAQVWEHSPYGEGTLLVLLAMADWANDDGFCWPSIPQLAHKSRQSERNTRYVLRRLEDDGVIQRIEHRGKGHRNEYVITLQPLQDTAGSIKRKPAKPAKIAGLKKRKPASSDILTPAKPASSDTKPASSDMSHNKDARADPSGDPLRTRKPSVRKSGRDRDTSKDNGHGHGHDDAPPTPEQQDEAMASVKPLLDQFLGRFLMPPAEEDLAAVQARKAEQIARAKAAGLV